MKTSKFKTSAKCGGCVAKIGEMLDKVVARDQWNIDLSDDRVIELVKEAGFKAEKLGLDFVRIKLLRHFY